MEENNNLTAERSLEIIRKSIEQSRRDMVKNAGSPLIAWGILVALTAWLVGLLVKHTGTPFWYFLWFPMMFLGFGINHYINKRFHVRPRSIIGDIVGYVWLSFGIISMAIPLVMYTAKHWAWHYFSQQYAPDEILKMPIIHFPVTTVIVIMLGLCTTITGFVLKDNWIKAGGIMAAIGGAVLATIYGQQNMQVISFVAVVGLLVPGIIMNLKYRKA
ncbi:MAG: hypothetical protein IJ244_00305 [Bacteroidaceae bacterium]|nr:hypothetical protein [Bacteroidaceae bacterium]